MVITSRKNPAAVKYRKLCGDKKEREVCGEFCAEGVRLCREAVDSGLDIRCALVTESAAEKNPELYKSLCEKAPVTLISEDLAEYISDTKTPQGFFIVAGVLDKSTDLRKIVNGKYLMLDDMRDSGNLGTVIRTCDALGMDGLIMSPGCADIYSPKVVRGAMGSLFRLPVITAELSQAVTALKKAGFQVYASVPDSKAQSIDNISFSQSCAVVVGNEANGVSPGIISAAGKKLYIPMKNAESLNAAVAAAIICREMTRGA